MKDQDPFDQWTKRLAGKVDLSKGTSRRSFLRRTGLAAAGIGAGIITASPRARHALAQQCTPPETQYEVADEDGMVTDALGTRFVRKGNYIVLDTGAEPSCSGGAGVGPDNTAGECGVSYFDPGFGHTYLSSDWTELDCRACPWQGSDVEASFTSHTNPIYISYATEAGQFICEGRLDGYGSDVWYRTSGPIGCWFWSGGTTDPNWNGSC